jgi:hypothetical protein
VAFAARRKLLGIRCVLKAATHDANLSVSFGGNRRQKKTRQGDGGLIKRVTGLRVLMIIVEITWPVETQFTNIKPASKKRLGEDAENSINL